MTLHRACTGDFAVRERRGLLSPTERLAFEAHLVACASCRADLQLGRIFDAPDAPELDDGARIQRLARVAETWTRSGRAPMGRRRARTLKRKVFLAVAACLILCCGVAAAALGVHPWARIVALVSRPPAARLDSPPSSPAGTQVRRGPSGVEPEAPAVVEPAIVEEEAHDRQEAPASPAASLRGANRSRHAPSRAEAPEDAAAMLRAANDARRSGDTAEAMALYAKLQRRFPSSPEAELSSVPFGEMLLADQKPQAALVQFERPAGALGGTLRPEVLYGRARALAALGDEAEERRAWRELIDEFPKCPYVETARRRLESDPSTAPSSR
ncbi:MAG TPA: tetratricopeptide repeat protein [Polyangiaceae bacterium]|jgi:tetratricopeptide (TPR) repeat protein